MSTTVVDPGLSWKFAVLAINLAQVAGTYDLGTVTGGDIVLMHASLYSITLGATFTSVTIQTNNAVSFVLLDAAGGARANFPADGNVALTWTQVQKLYLPSTKKLQYTIAGATGTGTARLAVAYFQATAGASLA